MIHYNSWWFFLCPIQLFSMVLSCVCTTTNPLDYLLTNSYQLWAWHSILLSYSLFSWYPAHCLTNGWMNQSVFSYDVCCWQLMQILWYFYKPLAADDHYAGRESLCYPNNVCNNGDPRVWCNIKLKESSYKSLVKQTKNSFLHLFDC